MAISSRAPSRSPAPSRRSATRSARSRTARGVGGEGGRAGALVKQTMAARIPEMARMLILLFLPLHQRIRDVAQRLDPFPDASDLASDRQRSFRRGFRRRLGNQSQRHIAAAELLLHT